MGRPAEVTIDDLPPDVRAAWADLLAEGVPPAAILAFEQDLEAEASAWTTAVIDEMETSP
jgi:hypothetical protein